MESGVVVVVDLVVASCDGRDVEGLLQGQPGLALVAADGNGAVEAVEVVDDVGVGLQLAEVGQALDEGPLVVAPLGPAVVVLGNAAQEDLAVDGAGAADDLAAGDDDVLGADGAAPAGEGPVVGRAHLGRAGRVAELQIVGGLLEVSVIGACLQQQHRAVGVFGQTGGKRAAA